MLYAKEVTTQDELIQINKLNQQNLTTSLSKQQQEEQGFVTWLYPVSLLQQMHNIAPSIIIKDDNAVVGYALVTPVEAGTFHPDLKRMIDNLEPLDYKGKQLSSYSYYIMGQVCIDKYYRGKEGFTMLFQKHKKLYSDKYELLVTEISTKNYRSQKAHEKVGFTTIYTYSDDLDRWNVVVWDWK
ncbi:MAG: GNAT family N-acetyltransferase [Chitinophagaceae bacterium]|nr:GNAT family N-acetyltransferase [Chitinophagaceae bacterium]